MVWVGRRPAGRRLDPDPAAPPGPPARRARQDPAGQTRKNLRSRSGSEPEAGRFGEGSAEQDANESPRRGAAEMSRSAIRPGRRSPRLGRRTLPSLKPESETAGRSTEPARRAPDAIPLLSCIAERRIRVDTTASRRLDDPSPRGDGAAARGGPSGCRTRRRSLRGVAESGDQCLASQRWPQPQRLDSGSHSPARTHVQPPTRF